MGNKQVPCCLMHLFTTLFWQLSSLVFAGHYETEIVGNGVVSTAFTTRYFCSFCLYLILWGFLTFRFLLLLIYVYHLKFIYSIHIWLQTFYLLPHLAFTFTLTSLYVNHIYIFPSINPCFTSTEYILHSFYSIYKWCFIALRFWFWKMIHDFWRRQK